MPESMPLLLIENDEQQRLQLAAIFEFIGYNQIIHANTESYQQHIDADNLDAVLIGQYGAQEKLQEIFDYFNEHAREIPILLLMSRESNRQLDNELVKRAFSIVNIPLSYSELTDILHRASLFRSSKKKKTGNFNIDLFRSMVGNSRAIRQVRSLIEQVAKSDATVLILGESGTDLATCSIKLLT